MGGHSVLRRATRSWAVDAPTAGLTRLVSDLVDVVALPPSSWAALEQHRTRWAHVLLRWADRDDVARVTVVDGVMSRLKARLTRQVPWISQEQESWHPTIQVIRVNLPVSDRLGWADDAVMTATAHALRHRLPAPLGRRLVMCANPAWAPVMRRLPSELSGFDAFDDWRCHGRAKRSAQFHHRVVRGYGALRRFNTVTTNTEEMRARLRSEFQAESVVVPNGVDLHAHVSPQAPPLRLPPRPFAVYVGVIEDRVDLELLIAVAEDLHPDVPVVVAGPANAQDAARLAVSRAIWLGPVDSRWVPGLLRAAHVGLLPHRVGPFTESMDPMKLLEYLASGLRVVSTPLSAARRSDRVVSAASAPEFVRAVRDLAALDRLASPDPSVVDRDWDVVAHNMWRIHTARGSGAASQD